MNYNIKQVDPWMNKAQTIHLESKEGIPVTITVRGLDLDPSLTLVGRLAEAAKGETDQIINISTQIGSRDLNPYVTFRWGAHACRLNPEEARHHAYAILAAANAAETDGFLVSFLKDKIDFPIEQAAPILNDFRKYREEQHLRAANEAIKRTEE